MQLHLEILPESQHKVWSLLRPVAGMGFVLYGGTAIALQLAHRQSIDFDFFSSMPLDADLLLERMSILKQALTYKVSDNTLILGYSAGNDTGSGLAGSVNLPMSGGNNVGSDNDYGSDIVQLSFFGNISFGRVGHPVIDVDNGLAITSLDDLMATELAVLLKRAEKKDYIDIAEMILHGVSLEKGLGSAVAIYGVTCSIQDALAALSYFDDGDVRELSPRYKELLSQALPKVGGVYPQKILSYSLLEDA